MKVKNTKGNMLFFAVEDLSIEIPNGNVLSDYFPALDLSVDDEGNNIGVESNDLSLYNRLKNNHLANTEYTFTKEQCDNIVVNEYVYTGDVDSLKDRKFKKINIVVHDIHEWVKLIELFKTQREALTERTIDFPEGRLLINDDWKNNFKPDGLQE